jgi:DNA polymerase-3 subunit delta
VVLIDGDDPTLVAEAVHEVVDDLLGSGNRDLTVEDHRGDGVDLAAVADSCATPSFLAERRIVVVRDVGRFSTEEVAPLLAYLENPLPSTALVLAAGGGAVAPRLAVAAKARGQVLSTKVSSRDARTFLRDRLKAAPVRFDSEAASRIEFHLGQDVSRVGAVIEVLRAAYGDGARLGAADVEPYLGEPGSVAPWDFTDAIDAGHTQDALVSLHRLLGGDERHPLVVLSILDRHVQSIMRLDNPAIRSELQAAEALGIGKGRSTFPARKALASSRRWGSRRIQEAMGLIADAELDLKGASGCPEALVLDVLVARLCRLGRASVGGAGRRGRDCSHHAGLFGPGPL